MTLQEMHRVQGFIAAFSQNTGRVKAKASQAAMDYLLREGGDPAGPLISTGEFGPTEFERLDDEDEQGFFIPIKLAEKWLGQQIAAYCVMRGGNPTKVLSYKASYYYGRWWAVNYLLQDPDGEPGVPWARTFEEEPFQFEAVLRIDLDH